MRVFDCNVSKFQSNRWRMFGDVRPVTNEHLHFYLYRYLGCIDHWSDYCITFIHSAALMCIYIFISNETFSCLTIATSFCHTVIMKVFRLATDVTVFQNYEHWKAIWTVIWSIKWNKFTAFSPAVFLLVSFKNAKKKKKAIPVTGRGGL
jgi:hypothetical protein